MTLVDDHGPDMDRDDILAAEYVVGVLPAEERWTASARIERDAAFARIVDGWEVYFAPLGSGYAPVEAPAAAKAAIDNRLFASSTASPARDLGVERRPLVEPRLLARPGDGGGSCAGDLRRFDAVAATDSGTGRATALRLARRRGQRRALPRCLSPFDRGGRPVENLRPARRRPRLRTLVGRRAERARLDGRHSTRPGDPSCGERVQPGENRGRRRACDQRRAAWRLSHGQGHRTGGRGRRS